MITLSLQCHSPVLRDHLDPQTSTVLKPYLPTERGFSLRSSQAFPWLVLPALPTCVSCPLHSAPLSGALCICLDSQLGAASKPAAHHPRDTIICVMLAWERACPLPGGKLPLCLLHRHRCGEMHATQRELAPNKKLLNHKEGQWGGVSPRREHALTPERQT